MNILTNCTVDIKSQDVSNFLLRLPKFVLDNDFLDFYRPIQLCSLSFLKFHFTHPYCYFNDLKFMGCFQKFNDN